MTDYIGPDLELQGAIVAVLKASAPLQALIGNPARIYQDAPPDVWPGAYITIGDCQTIDDSAECLTACEVYPDLHVWSQGKGWSEVKRIASLVRKLLNNATLDLTENRCVSILHETTHMLTDEDGKTRHAVVTFKALVEEPGE